MNRAKSILNFTILLWRPQKDSLIRRQTDDQKILWENWWIRSSEYIPKVKLSYIFLAFEFTINYSQSFSYQKWLTHRTTSNSNNRTRRPASSKMSLKHPFSHPPTLQPRFREFRKTGSTLPVFLSNGNNWDDQIQGGVLPKCFAIVVYNINALNGYCNLPNQYFQQLQGQRALKIARVMNALNNKIGNLLKGRNVRTEFKNFQHSESRSIQ